MSVLRLFRGIRWRIAIPYVGLIVLTMAVLALYLSSFVRSAYMSQLEAHLTDDARLIADALAGDLADGPPAGGLDVQVLHYAGLVGARVTIIAPDGVVLGESHDDRSRMENHLYRPEVQAALAGGQGSSVRFSNTVNYDMMYVAVRIGPDEQPVGIARVALPLDEVQASVLHLRSAVLLATLLATGLAVVLSLVIAQRTARPVRRLTAAVNRMAAGDLNARLLPSSSDEVATLTRAFNDMAAHLQENLSSLAEERGRLAGVLEHMADGIIITDGEGRVCLINPAAAHILDTDEKGALGRSFAQVVRDYRLIGLWQQCRDKGAEEIEPVEIGYRGPFLQAIVTPLQDADPHACLVILQDLTRVRRLETVRRDFISNVSHELRTPLASLKALVDTLRDGALDDPPAAQRFLDRMESEVDALTQVVQELLELSRIESGRAPFRLAPMPVSDVVLPPIDRLRPQAERAELQLTADLPPDLPPVLVDLERVRQVVTNLVHNAIKFTPKGGRVEVAGYRLQGAGGAGVGPENSNLKPEALPPGDWVLIRVRDTGVGIPSDDLPRIFERFYKADRARSGGGTGLGLAIAKHIVQAHGGRIWAESTEGRGSTFYFSLPAAGETRS